MPDAPVEAGLQLTTFVSRERGTDLERLTELVDAGDLMPAVDRTYALAGAPDGMRHLEAGQARGKVTITVRD